jgi:hypothetical protein
MAERPSVVVLDVTQLTQAVADYVTKHCLMAPGPVRIDFQIYQSLKEPTRIEATVRATTGPEVLVV